MATLDETVRDNRAIYSAGTTENGNDPLSVGILVSEKDRRIFLYG